MEIKIVNAREIGAVEEILTVKRDHDGKMTGAAVVRLVDAHRGDGKVIAVA